jgi:hypothetical protein
MTIKIYHSIPFSYVYIIVSNIISYYKYISKDLNTLVIDWILVFIKRILYLYPAHK